jgi:hypothetical protein
MLLVNQNTSRAQQDRRKEKDIYTYIKRERRRKVEEEEQ